MSDLRELYQEIVLDHSRRPRGFGKLEGATHRAQGYNPLCGDQLDLELRIESGVVRDVRFTGKGCAISTASASLLTEAIRGRTLDEASCEMAAEVALSGARAHEHNAFKVELGRRTLVRALLQAAAMEV